MASDRSIRRYRRWYAALLRLYPRRYHERFGEPMVQTFTDLARERSHANQALHGFAVGTFAETAAGIIRENVTHMIMQNRNYLRWVLVTAAVLLVPLLAMIFRIAIPDPGSGTDGVNWGPMDFAIVGVIVLGAGLLYEYATRRARNTSHRAAVGIAALAGLFLVWANLAVGMMDTEPANLMYVLVLAVALIGAAIARFEPREASIAMFVTAAAHVVVVVIGLAADLGPEVRADAFLVTAWIASALLFRQANVEPAPSR